MTKEKTLPFTKSHIEKIIKADEILVFVPDTGSPNALLQGNKETSINIAASITARYSDRKDEKNIEVSYKQNKTTKKIRARAATNEELTKWRI